MEPWGSECVRLCVPPFLSLLHFLPLTAPGNPAVAQWQWTLGGQAPKTPKEGRPSLTIGAVVPKTWDEFSPLPSSLCSPATWPQVKTYLQ